MRLIHTRDEFGDDYCTGKLYLDGGYFCLILEDTDRQLETNPGAKIHGRTAIPRGTYRVILDYSNRFKRVLPRFLDVPGYEGIRVHSGNSDEDTEGCLIPGSTRNGNWVSNSRNTFAKLFELMEEAYERKEDITWEVA